MFWRFRFWLDAQQKPNHIFNALHGSHLHGAHMGGCSKESTGPHLVDSFRSLWLSCHQFWLAAFQPQLGSWTSYLYLRLGLYVALFNGALYWWAWSSILPMQRASGMSHKSPLGWVSSEHLRRWRSGIRSWYWAVIFKSHIVRHCPHTQAIPKAGWTKLISPTARCALCQLPPRRQQPKERR